MEIHFGERIKSLTEANNWTVKDVASKLKMTDKAIYDIFAKPDISTKNLRIFAKLFDISLVDFFEKDMSEESFVSKKNSNVGKLHKNDEIVRSFLALLEKSSNRETSMLNIIAKYNSSENED